MAMFLTDMRSIVRVAGGREHAPEATSAHRPVLSIRLHPSALTSSRGQVGPSLPGQQPALDRVDSQGDKRDPELIDTM
jgi:hypothetical protein